MREGPKSNIYLPRASALGSEILFKRDENARIHDEFHWLHEVSRALNSAVHPESYRVANQVVDFVEDNSSSMLANVIKSSHNKIIQGIND